MDYRVRLYIANGFFGRASQLEKKLRVDSESQELLIRAALCYYIGFGVKRNLKNRRNFYSDVINLFNLSSGIG